MLKDPVDIARACYMAYVNNDRDVLEHLIAKDFTFTSPIDNRLNRSAYFSRCWPNSENIVAFDFIHVLPDGDRVFVTYEATGTEGNRFRNTEILTIIDGQITDVEVYFGWNLPHPAKAGKWVES